MSDKISIKGYTPELKYSYETVFLDCLSFEVKRKRIEDLLNEKLEEGWIYKERMEIHEGVYLFIFKNFYY